ncbi:class I tRNA ligase family protein [Tistrella sp. BH-R2-4]|uniref:Class I tRNA ligase family protein n=1 Tax=Tistrella arctica TaxID=3133430 RepID=A0ABU9YIG4_9PROT
MTTVLTDELILCAAPPADRDIDAAGFAAIWLAADVYARGQRLLGRSARVLIAAGGGRDGDGAGAPATLRRAGVDIDGVLTLGGGTPGVLPLRRHRPRQIGDRPMPVRLTVFAGRDVVTARSLIDAVSEIDDLGPVTDTRIIAPPPLTDLSGGSFDPSTGRAIFLTDLLDRMPAEALRFYLALMSEPQDARELSMADLARTHNLFMVRDLGTSLAAISNLDPVAGTALAQDRPEDDLMLDFRNRLHAALDAHSFSLAALAGVVLGVNGQMKQARLYGTPERIPRLAGLFQLFARPLMPAAADGIAAFLGLGQGWGEPWARVGGEIPSCSARLVRGSAPGFDAVDEAALVALESGMAAA